jgi:hypothetical protein
MENTCNCGDTRLLYYPDENQHEPACWECYENPPTANFDVLDLKDCMETISTEDDLPF